MNLFNREYDTKLVVSMAIVVVIVLFLIIIFVRFDYKYDKEENERQKKVDKTINWLYKAANEICYKSGMYPLYEIRETFGLTYSEKTHGIHNTKGIIYIVIWDKEKKQIFDYNTLIYAVIHEITHILNPTLNHEKPFDVIESILLKNAEELKYYDKKIPIDKDYITMDM